MNDIVGRVAALAPRTPVHPDDLDAARDRVARAIGSPAPELLSTILETAESGRRRPLAATRVRRTALVGIAAASLVGLGFVAGGVLVGGTTSGQNEIGAQGEDLSFLAPATGTGTACRTDVLAPPLDGAPTAAPRPKAFLPADVVPTQVSTRDDYYPCGQVPAAAVFYAPDGSAGISMYADVADPVVLQGGDSLTVRGRTGVATTPPAGHHFLTWVEPGGVRWLVIANGMSLAKLVDDLETAKLTGTSVDRGYTVEGLERAPKVRRDAGATTESTWSADFTATPEAVPGLEGPVSVHLEVVSRASEDALAKLSWGGGEREMTTVDGAPAVFSASGEGGSLLSWNVGDRRFLVFADAHDVDVSRAIAESLEPLASDDPRVADQRS